jgi:glycosyltransferase involved in cell wall biosynthesis
MRILYLNPGAQLGGAEISLLDLISSVRAAEPHWELFLVTGEQGPLIDKAMELGVQTQVVTFPKHLARLGDSGKRLFSLVWQLAKSASATALYILKLRRSVAAIRPDLIHSNGFKMHVLAIWARAGRVPVLWHVRDYVSSRFLMRRLLRCHASRCAAVLGNSKSVVADVNQVCRDRVRSVCIYNAIDLTRYTPAGARADLDSLSGLRTAPDETLRIGLIATMAHWKGHRVFLRALAKLPEDLRYRAYIVGGAIYQTDNSQLRLEALMEFASELGIADRVGFTGFVADTAGAMRALDIVVHASTEPEPFGRVVAEGLACGRAVIYSRAGGTTELVTDGWDALGHPPGDETALAAQILKLAQNPALRERLGRAGRSTAEQRFERGRLAKEIVPLYRQLSVQMSQGVPEELALLR